MKLDERLIQFFRGEAEKLNKEGSEELTERLADFYRGKKDKGFGKNFLINYLKKDNSVKDIKKYKLQLDSLQVHSIEDRRKYPVIFDELGNKFRDRSYEGIYQFCITYKNELIANLGFDVQPNCIFINQIQGVQGKQKLLKKYNFRQALVDYVTEWAKKYGISEVIIQSVDNDELARSTFKIIKEHGLYPKDFTFDDAKKMDPDEEMEIKKKALKIDPIKVHLMPHHGFIVYDVTAKSLGFKKGSEGNYHKKGA